MDALNIKWLHVESSSRCNAWCPACPRNNNGYGLRDGVIETDLDTTKFAEVLNLLYNLETVQFCGNLGEPVIASNFLELVKIAKKHCKKIQIHTNGSLRSSDWWGQLAELLNDIDHDVWFGIDGLEDTHELYRQGTSFKKIIENAKSFISKGGIATWQFIPFEHNQHQYMNCLKLSREIGFKKFKLVKLYRQRTNSRHWKTGMPIEINPPSNLTNLIRIEGCSQTSSVNLKDCMHLNLPSIYLSALGKLSTCCYFGSIKWYDDVYQLLESKLDLTHHRCLKYCGQ